MKPADSASEPKTPVERAKHPTQQPPAEKMDAVSGGRAR